MDQDISKEHHQATHDHASKTHYQKPALVILALLIIVGISFYAGTYYQKHHQPTLTSSHLSGQAAGQFGGFGGRLGDRVIGQVTAISSTSISVQNSRTGSTDTLSITSSTQITNAGQAVAVGSIQVGNTVFVTENSSDTSQASSILVNPSFGGGSTQPGSSPAPTGTLN